MSRIPFNSQNLQILAECSLEPRVPNVTGLPILGSDGRTDEVVPVGYAVDSCKSVDHRLKLVEIVLRCVSGWTMSVSSVEIRFVPHLVTKYIAAKYPLSLCDNLQSQV